MRICFTLTNLLPIFVETNDVLAGFPLIIFDGGGSDVVVVVVCVVVTAAFATDNGINFFGVFGVGVSLFDFGLTVMKLVNDVCSVVFFETESLTDADAAAIVEPIDLLLGDVLLDRLLIVGLSDDDASFSHDDFLSAAAAADAARVFGKRSFTGVAFPKLNGFALFCEFAWLRVSFIGGNFSTAFAALDGF